MNENYARELMELHTLGVDGGYTQKDVQEVARALTGWTFNRQNGEFVFNPMIHDAGEKMILGQKFPAGHGEEEGEQVLDLVARAPATARFITTKLARHFVTTIRRRRSSIAARDKFSKTDGDIRETVRCIVTVAGVLQSLGVSRQGEDAVRGRGVGAARAQRAGGYDAAHGAGRRSARPADLRTSDARRLAGSRRRVDEHRRNPQSHQLWPESRSGSGSGARLAQLAAVRRRALAAPRAASGQRREVDARRAGLRRDATGVDERREPDAGERAGERCERYGGHGRHRSGDGEVGARR